MPAMLPMAQARPLATPWDGAFAADAIAPQHVAVFGYPPGLVPRRAAGKQRSYGGSKDEYAENTEGDGSCSSWFK